MDAYKLLDVVEKTKKFWAYSDLTKKIAGLTFQSEDSVQNIYARALEKAAKTEPEEERVEKDTNVAPQKEDSFAQLKKMKKEAEDAGLLRQMRSKYDFDVFISHSSKDAKLAKRIYTLLLEHNIRPFLSEIEIPELHTSNYAETINEVLSVVQNMVVIGSESKNIDSGWVKFEWNAFGNELLSGHKKGNIITVLAGDTSVNRDSIPFFLRQFEVLSMSGAEEHLDSFIVKES